MAKEAVEQAYSLAKQSYSNFGVDTDAAIQKALNIPV